MRTGLSLGAGASVRAGAQGRYGSSAAPTTASEAAFGPDLAPSAAIGGLAPNNPAGVAFWIGIGGLVALGLIYYSLPG